VQSTVRGAQTYDQYAKPPKQFLLGDADLRGQPPRTSTTPRWRSAGHDNGVFPGNLGRRASRTMSGHGSSPFLPSGAPAAGNSGEFKKTWPRPSATPRIVRSRRACTPHGLDRNGPCDHFGYSPLKSPAARSRGGSLNFASVVLGVPVAHAEAVTIRPTATIACRRSFS